MLNTVVVLKNFCGNHNTFTVQCSLEILQNIAFGVPVKKASQTDLKQHEKQ